MSQCFMHGDLVNGIGYSIFLPFYYYKAVTEAQTSPHPEGMLAVSLVATLVAWSSFRSWRQNHVIYSWISFLATTLSFLGIGLYHWPHGDEAMLLVQFVWQLVLLTANTAHTLTTKLYMGLISTVAAINLSYWSSLYTVRENVWFILGGAVLYVGINVVLYQVMKQRGIVPTPELHQAASSSPVNYWERKGEIAAMFILVVFFLYFVGSEAYIMMTQPGYNVIGGYKIVRCAVFGATGFVATGIFRKPNEQLNKSRGVQTGNLNLARFALDKSETATAYIDPQQSIQWCNASFVSLTRYDSTTVLNKTLYEALRPSIDVAKKLKQGFRQAQPFDVEAILCGKIVQIKVSCMSDQIPTNGYFVVLQDVTEERALEQFRHYKNNEARHLD